MGYLSNRLQKPVTQNTEHNVGVNAVENLYIYTRQSVIEKAFATNKISREQFQRDMKEICEHARHIGECERDLNMVRMTAEQENMLYCQRYGL